MTHSARRAFVAALVLPFALTQAASAQPEDGLPVPNRLELGGGLTGPKAPDGFLGRRPLLKELSAADQKLLASLILDYTTRNDSAVVKVHETTMTDPKLHSVHQAPYTQLFSWHRTYIEGLEAFLKSKGQSKFVPLPKWVPSDPIPPAFGVDKKGKKIVKNLDPKQDWSQFLHSRLSAFKQEIRKGSKDTTPNKLILADTLVVPHNNTHNTIGGTMASMSSPAAPIFWCYHAFIDDVAWDYEKMPKPKDPPLGGPKEEGTTTIGGELAWDEDGCCLVIKTPAGDFEVVNEPMKTMLARLVGKTVYVQAKLDGKKATVESVTGMTGMSTLVVRDASGKELGTVGTMAEVRVTGEKGARFEIEHEGKKGFILKSGATIGAGHPSATPGVNGAMNHGHGGHDHH